MEQLLIIWMNQQVFQSKYFIHRVIFWLARLAFAPMKAPRCLKLQEFH